jgi:uroporphyrinogen-III synthase
VTVPSAAGRLSGLSVVVTRPKEGTDDLEDALLAAGAAVVAFPVVQIADPDDGGAALAAAVARLSAYRWVVFTSANAVRRFVAAARGGPALHELRRLGGVQFAAVGPATAAALADRDLVADLVAERANAEGLGEVFPAVAPPHGAVLFPASAGARPTLPAALRAKGWAVDEVVAYRTVPVPQPSADVVAQLERADAVTFASPSAVEAYVSLRSAGRDERLPVPAVVACIGPVTARAARRAGLDVAAVASDASATGLVDALAAVLVGAARSPEGRPR